MSYRDTIAALALFGDDATREELMGKARELFNSRFPGERFEALTPRQRYDYLMAAIPDGMRET